MHSKWELNFTTWMRKSNFISNVECNSPHPFQTLSQGESKTEQHFYKAWPSISIENHPLFMEYLKKEKWRFDCFKCSIMLLLRSLSINSCVLKWYVWGKCIELLKHLHCQAVNLPLANDLQKKKRGGGGSIFFLERIMSDLIIRDYWQTLVPNKRSYFSLIVIRRYLKYAILSLTRIGCSKLFIEMNFTFM